MKRYIFLVLLGLGIGQVALAAPTPPGAPYANYGVVTEPPVIDSPSFFNAGIFNVVTISSLSPTNTVEQDLYLSSQNDIPFETKDTLDYTNSTSGVMIGTPGFGFDTALSDSRHTASSFVNEGFMQGIDGPGLVYAFSAFEGTSIIPDNDLSQPVPSQLRVLATNIVNAGSMSVGDDGLIQLAGDYVTNAYASLAAGFISTVGATNYIEDTTGYQGAGAAIDFNNGPYFYDNSVGIYDIYWGITNGLATHVDDVDLPFGLPNVIDGTRGFDLVPIIPTGDFAEYAVYAYGIQASPTNIYYNLVFINTNIANSNISVQVRFAPAFFLQYESTTIATEPGGIEDIVQFSEPVFDVINPGQTVTNGIYLIDQGAYLPVMSVSTDGISVEGKRPNAFEVTTVTPPEWVEGTTNSDYPFYDPDWIWAPDEFQNNIVPMETAVYGCQIGHNPANISGSFATLATPGTEAYLDLEFTKVNLPDPSNQPARIEINGGNVDLTQARMRAEGMVIINATNLGGSNPQAVDFGEANLTLGATNGSLTITNMVPTTFHRIRGDIYALSATWQNLMTNFDIGHTNAATTNFFNYHVLIVDQNIFGSFPTSVHNLKLTGTGSITLQNDLNVINSAVINTSNLTVSSSNFFSQNAANFTPAFTPSMRNLLINSNGILGSAGSLDIGFNANVGQTAPTGRRYTVNTITNFGQMIGAAPLLQSAIFENDGQVIANSGGSMVIEANALGLGLAVTNATNSLLSDGNIELSAATIGASNSIISAGTAGRGSLTLYATEKLTDFVSGTPTTNTNSVIINNWTVTDGFSMPVKPATGDLFGTEIHSIATNSGEATVVWAGTDMGATAAGFSNNQVIGRLVLDRQSTNAVMRFAAAGPANAMYVDYLELTNLSLTAYRKNLIIDSNFKIYFADANLDPEKLMEVYPNLVWVQSFAGPNSSVAVPYINSSNFCLMNAALADSSSISFFNGEANSENQPYVLNNPSNPSDFIPCSQVDGTELRSLLVSTSAPGGSSSLNLLNISVSGEGSISPELKSSELALGKSYTLTATPAPGWVFANWSTVGLGSSVNANSRTLSFSFVSNTLITANFVPNPFNVVRGVYNGLFFENNAVNPGSSGAFALTLMASGSFSGHLLMGPDTYTFSSQFSGVGSAQGVRAASGMKSVTLNLQLDLSGQSGQIVGDVNGGTWDSSLTANIAPVWTTKHPSPFAGNYTMVLPWTSGGDSYGAGAITKLGVLTMAGTLADGTAFSSSAPVSQNGQWPFYAYAPAGKDSILGWVSVTNGLTATNITWSKAAGKGLLYSAGFTNVLALVGSTWQAPARDAVALNLPDPTVVLSGGGLPEALTISVSSKNSLTFATTNLTLSIIGSSGSFSGWFENPETGKRQTISGVVLQNSGQASGFFQGVNASGTVLLQNQQGQ